MSQENVELLRRAADAFNVDDDETFASLGHPDLEWRTGLLGTPTYRGREGVLAMLRDVRKAWTDMHIEIAGEPVDGVDAAVFEARLAARGRTTGAPVAGTQHFAVEFRDGLPWRIAAFADRAEALEAVGLSE